jgi:hypothetical protein
MDKLSMPRSARINVEVGCTAIRVDILTSFLWIHVILLPFPRRNFAS